MKKFEEAQEGLRRLEKDRGGSKEFEKVRKSSTKFEKSPKIRELWGMPEVRKDSTFIE